MTTIEDLNTKFNGMAIDSFIKEGDSIYIKLNDHTRIRFSPNIIKGSGYWEDEAKIKIELL